MLGDAEACIDEAGALPRTRSISWWDRLWRPFWVLPVAIVVVAVVAGYLVPEVDRALRGDLPYLFQGGPDGARNLLGTIAGAMISVTGLVFSITMVVVQLASSQYSPRILADFLASRMTQVTLGIFAASFTYALTVLRSVRDESNDAGEFVPQLSVTLAFVLVLASVGTFLAFIHHITRSIQVSSIVSHLGDTTLDVVRRSLPEPSTPAARFDAVSSPGDEDRVPQTLEAREHGAVVELDHRGIVAHAAEHDLVVEVLLQVGDFVADGLPAARVWRPAGTPQLSDDALAPIRRRIVVEQDRFFNQDPAFGIRKLVDIAERALSPGTNDPTTAVQVLDELHRVLRLAVTRAELPARVSRDGHLRLLHRPQRVSQLIDLALAEPIHYGNDSLQVPRRVLALLDDVVTVALDQHRQDLERWRTHARAVIDAQEARDADLRRTSRAAP